MKLNLLDDRVALIESVTVGWERPCDLTTNDSCLFAFHLDAETLRLIQGAYRDCQGNVTAISSRLKDNHRIPLPRTRIDRVLDDLGLPRLTRGRG